MSWRGSTSVADRIWSCLTYLLPLMDALAFAGYFLRDFPALAVFLLPLTPLMAIYSIQYVPLLIFFALFIFVVRNERIAHFVRFNAMQAILIDIVLFIVRILAQIIGLVPGGGLAVQILYTTIFLGTVVAVVYAVAQSAMGKYAEIPTISDAVYTQVR